MALLCMMTEKFAFSGNVSNEGIFNQQLSLIIIVDTVVGISVIITFKTRVDLGIVKLPMRDQAVDTARWRSI